MLHTYVGLTATWASQSLILAAQRARARPFVGLQPLWRGPLIFFSLRAQAVTHYNDPKVLAEVSTGLGEAMVGIDCRASNFYSYAARSE